MPSPGEASKTLYYNFILCLSFEIVEMKFEGVIMR
jgi:hypothetical protein